MRIQALRAKVTSKHRTVEDSLAEHQNIVKLLKAREKAKALSLLGVHIRAASRDYQIMLQEQARGREQRGGRTQPSDRTTVWAGTGADARLDRGGLRSLKK